MANGMRPGILEEAGAEFQRIVEDEARGVTAPVSQTPPRPIGGSAAPRPQTIAERDAQIRAFVTDPRAQKFRDLRTAKTVRERKAVEAAFAPETPAAQRAREQRAARAASQVAGKIAIAEAAPRIQAQAQRDVANIQAASADLKSRLEAKSQAGERAVDMMKIQTEADTEERRLKNELDISIRGQDAETNRSLIDAQSDALVAKIQQGKKPTPAETATIKRLEGIEKSRGIALTGLADLQGAMSEASGKQLKALQGIQETLTGMLSDFDQEQIELLGSMGGAGFVPPEADAPVVVEQQTVEETPEGVVATDEVAVTTDNAIDVTGDGQTTAEDVTTINNALKFVEDYETLKRNQPQNGQLKTRGAEFIRAQEIVKAFRARAKEEATQR